MNAEAAAVEHQLAGDIEQHGGLEGFRRHALKHLKLKTVIKESHCTQIQQLSFNLVDPQCSNLFATVGKDQATVYDDTHMGKHISIVAHYTSPQPLDENATPEELHACAWLSSHGWTKHPYGDACLAVGGADGVVRIISVAEARVIAELPGHASAVVELGSAPGVPGLLLVLHRDGLVRLWAAAEGRCLLALQADVFTAALHPEGRCLVGATRQGKLFRWQLAEATPPPVPPKEQQPGAGPWDGGASAAHSCARPAAPPPYAVGARVASRQRLELPGEGACGTECIRFLPGERLVTRGCDGRMRVHDLRRGCLLSSWRVPGTQQAATPSHASRCCLGHTADGAYVCAGNTAGSTFVFDAATGAQLRRVDAIRVEGPVRAAALSSDCRHLLAVVGAGFLFRWEYCQPEEPLPVPTAADAARVLDQGEQTAPADAGGAHSNAPAVERSSSVLLPLKRAAGCTGDEPVGKSQRVEEAVQAEATVP